MLRELQEAGSEAATLKQIEAMLNDIQSNCFLQVELAAVVDTGKPMVESTYILEGDGALTWRCYEQLILIQNSVNVVNATSQTSLLYRSTSLEETMLLPSNSYGVAAAQPGWDYFSQTVMGTLNSQVVIFKAARWFSSHQIC